MRVWDRAGAEATARQAYFETWNTTKGMELGVKINYEPQATDKYQEALRLAFQTGKGPDVFHAVSSDVDPMVQSGWIQPIDTVVSQETMERSKPFIPSTSELVVDGKTYAIPTVGFTIRLFYNKDIFTESGLDANKPPKTLSEMSQMAQAITKAGAGKFYGMAIPTAWVGFPGWGLVPIAESNDKSLDINMFNRSTGKYESTRLAPVISMYREAIANKTAFPGAETMSIDGAAKAFSEGRAAMLIMGAMAVSQINAVGGVPEGAATAPIPTIDGQTAVWTPMNAGFAFAMSSKVSDKAAAASALEAITSIDIQKALAKAGVPPLAQEAWSEVSIPLLKGTAPTSSDLQWPRSPSPLLTTEGQPLNAIITELVLNQDADINAGLSEVQARFQKAFDSAVQSGKLKADRYRD